MKVFFTALALSGILIYSESFARPERVGQIPNGVVNKCANCHVNPAGGGARNKFGQTVGSQFLDNNGKVKWGAELAAIDSDNDGFTNGAELSDPAGAWRIGDPAPGKASDVSKPGDETSKPPTMVVEAIELINKIFTYPNPVVNNVTINLNLTASLPVRYDVYNTLGELVFSSSDFYMNEGENSLNWNTTNNNGNPVNAGEYILAVKSGTAVTTNKIVVTR